MFKLNDSKRWPVITGLEYKIFIKTMQMLIIT